MSARRVLALEEALAEPAAELLLAAEVPTRGVRGEPRGRSSPGSLRMFPLLVLGASSTCCASGGPSWDTGSATSSAEPGTLEPFFGSIEIKKRQWMDLAKQ